MAVHIVRTRSGGGTGKIIFGAIMAIAFGMGTVAACEEYLSDTADSLLPVIACGILAVAGVCLVISGICGNRRKTSFSGHGQDPEEILKMFRENSESMHQQMEQLRRQGVSGTYQVTQTTRTVTRTTAGGTTTTTETTHQTSGDVPSSENTVVSVTCDACGGITRLKVHEVGACRFCGSKIRG